MNEKSLSEIPATEQSDNGEFWSSILEKAVADGLEKDLGDGKQEIADNSDAAILAAAAAAEIDKLMGDLVSAREYLSSEAERIQRETARLRNLSKTAVASVHIISDNLSKWRPNGKQAA